MSDTPAPAHSAAAIPLQPMGRAEIEASLSWLSLSWLRLELVLLIGALVMAA